MGDFVRKITIKCMLFSYTGNLSVESQVNDILPLSVNSASSEQLTQSRYYEDLFRDLIKYQMVVYEGGLSLDTCDVGNYYKGQLIGTKHGITASFAFGLGLDKDSLYNLTIDDAVTILYNYLIKDLNLECLSEEFIVIYVLWGFYYGKEKADYYVCLYYGLEPNAYNTRKIMYSYELDYRLALYLQNIFEQKLLNSMYNNPIYARGWYRRYLGVLQYASTYSCLKPSYLFIRTANQIIHNNTNSVLSSL